MYSAASARSISRSTSWPGANAATPIETVTGERVVADLDRVRGDGGAQALRDRAGLLEVRLGEHDHELLAAVAGQDVVGAQGRPATFEITRRTSSPVGWP